MSIDNEHDRLSHQLLAQLLIQLTGQKASRIADAADISRPNLYNWFKGKSQSLSEQRVQALMAALGLEHGRLSGRLVHRWQVGNSLDVIKRVLHELTDSKALEAAEVYFVKCGPKWYFNMLRIPCSQREYVTILVTFDKKKGSNFPLNAGKLGFGIDEGIAEIPHRIWETWWHAPFLEVTDFWIAAKPHFEGVAENSYPKMPPESLIALRTQYEQQIAVIAGELKEQTAENAGLRGIIRALLRELRKIDPQNPLLDDQERRWQFNTYYQEELDKLNSR